MRSPTVSPILQQLAQQASDDPERIFLTLAHHIDVDFLREAYHRTSKKSTPGVDGVTASAYAENLEANLSRLHETLRTGRYKALPVKRKWIDKEDGSRRPIGVPVLEDKIVQRAVLTLLEAIYEQDFHVFSYGFRPGRSPHDALGDVRQQCWQHNIGWIVDADISGCFDSLDHSLLRAVLRERIQDGSMLRLIGKWLKAGVLDGEQLTYPDQGSPQGGVISPMLANIFLHRVLDDWFVREIQPCLNGRSFVARFADDFVIGCECEDDARRIMAVLPKRFARYGLTIHPQKTTMIAFGRPDGRAKTSKQNGTFDFLGLTHFWAKSRKGNWVIKRKTAAPRVRRTVKAHWQWCRLHRHLPLKVQHQHLSQKLRGHYQYYGITGNYRMLQWVQRQVETAWRFWLSRRSRTGAIDWDKFKRLQRTYALPVPRIVHQI